MTSDRSGEAGSVSTGRVRPAEPGLEIKRLEVFIGRWLTEGHLVGEDGAPGGPIVASDVYESSPGGFFVVHPAYGRIEDVGVGGLEVIGYDPATGAYRTHFFDSHGNTSSQTLPRLTAMSGSGRTRPPRCTGILSDAGQTLTAHHERRTEAGSWAPSMDVVLTKIG